MKLKSSYLLVSAIMLLIAVSIITYRFTRQSNPDEVLLVQFAYPVTSINPTTYDDWESGFIGNHIYYRLLPEESKPWIPHITDNVSITCQFPQSKKVTGNCETVKITFIPKPFRDCNNRPYTIADIRNEFESILKEKAWILPMWKRCSDDEKSICVTGKYLPDQIRRMYGAYFRFGWSKAQIDDAISGSGIYCLHGQFDSNGGMKAGLMVPLTNDTKLPKIQFHTSQKSDNEFHLAIYGSKELLKDSRQNIQVHTPLAYYVITNPRLDGYGMPWNTAASKKLFHDILTEKDVFFAETPQFVRFAPEGFALQAHTSKQYKGQLMLALPDYLPACKKLAAALNKEWKNSARAYCTDIVAYVYKHVIENKQQWDGFFVGVSASDPSRDSLRNQYFSPYSPSSWTYDYLHPDNLFYLVGIGQSLATIDGKRICDIRPNPLGLSDLFVSDLLHCEGN